MLFVKNETKMVKPKNKIHRIISNLPIFIMVKSKKLKLNKNNIQNTKTTAKYKYDPLSNKVKNNVIIRILFKKKRSILYVTIIQEQDFKKNL